MEPKGDSIMSIGQPPLEPDENLEIEDSKSERIRDLEAEVEELKEKIQEIKDNVTNLFVATFKN